MDIIDETGLDVVHRLNQDFRFRMQYKGGAVLNVKSLERLWSSQSNEVSFHFLISFYAALTGS